MNEEFIEALWPPTAADYADPGENPVTGLARPMSRRRRFWRWITRQTGQAEPVESLAQAMRVHDLQDRKTNWNLRRLYALALLFAMVAQVAVADLLFWKYMQSYDYRVPEQSISAWLGATVVEIIGLIAIITRFLFGGEKKDD